MKPSREICPKVPLGRRQRPMRFPPRSFFLPATKPPMLRDKISSSMVVGQHGEFD